MKTTTTADRLQEIMNKRGLRQIDILEMCKPYCAKYGVKLNRNDLSQYVNGKTKPGQDKLTVLSSALGVTETWLMGYEENKNLDIPTYPNIFPLQVKKYPLLGSVACGEPIFKEADRESYILSGTEIPADFCLKCEGDSMVNARILDGDIVFIRRQEQVENGEIAAVSVNDEVTLKRVVFFPEKDMIILKPENSKYHDMVFTDEELNTIKILGKAVAFQSDVI